MVDTKKNYKICNLGEVVAAQFYYSHSSKIANCLCSESGMHSLPSRSSRCPRLNLNHGQKKGSP